MAIPEKAVAFPDSADPYDHVEWVAECKGRILEVGEAIDTFALVLDSAAVALGISISTDADYLPTKVPSSDVAVTPDQSIRYWLEVDPAFREDSAFTLGVKAAVKVSIVTDSVPPRRRQRTWVATLEQL